MGSEGDQRERGFTIIDKRGRAEEEEAPAASEPSQAGGPRPTALPQVDFASFVLSLGTSALYHLGQIADPESGKPAAVNLPVARQTIDTLAVLEEKTRGNLTEEEAELLTHLLTDLRMRFVEASK